MIAEVRVHRLRAALQQRFGWSLNWTSARETTIIEVLTNDGLTGWGEGACSIDLIRERREAVIGRSPFEVESIFEALRGAAGTQGRPGAPACPGLDLALWDLAGKASGLPVSALLGKRHRDRVGAYCTALYRKDWPDLAEGLAEESVCWKQRGFRSMKMKIGYSPEIDMRIVRAVRDAIGYDTGLAVDSNCAYDAATAVRLAKRLENFDLLWWEEPVLADDFAGYRRLKNASGIPIAGGETGNADWLALNYIVPGLVDILQPDVEHTGLTGARLLSKLCWLQHLRLIPHNWGSAIRTAATLQWISTVPPLTPALQGAEAMIEFDQTECPWRDAIVRNRIAPGENSSLAVPDGPGLGVDVDADAVKEFCTETSICR